MIEKEKLHKIPKDLKEKISNTAGVLDLWDDLTPLSRNEWICFVESAKKDETRQKRINRVCGDLSAGKRRPCCWAGCPHRN
ncbi:MAG: YdeI/OmpD-associated family protein [Candidatus Pacebacteria bacterium]|nr:YdeI/OmpD-associated family protein [Candidatus Paceibacterota bacterium]MBP9715734.1 YdeI/OmpD-associated family protein [Candidatus Paceibacterota bacterium]